MQGEERRGGRGKESEIRRDKNKEDEGGRGKEGEGKKWERDGDSCKEKEGAEERVILRGRQR